MNKLSLSNLQQQCMERVQRVHPVLKAGLSAEGLLLKAL